MAKKIVILGAPNVGKSSLFNRLLRDKIAITSDIEGTTRDINIKKIALNSYHALLCDTAGLARKANGIFKNVKKLIFDFISEGDLILYVISAECGINDDDLRTFRTFKNAVLIVNKTDIEKNERWEYGAFGAEKVFFVSSLHNRGMKQLKDFLESWVGNLDLHSADSRESRESNKIQSKSQNDSRGSILDEKSGLRSHERGNKTDCLLTKRVASLPDLSPKDNRESAQNVINIGIIGRVNVGKSSILNALLNKQRSLVSDIEGTTIDPVSDEIAYNGKILRFIDTAGIRRASKIEGIEKFALTRTKRVLEQSNIALLVLDSSSNFVELDEKISGLSQKYNLGIIILLNKWDIKCADFRAFSDIIKRKFAYLSYAPILTISALQMRHIEDIKATILRVWENMERRIPTAQLNSHIQIATQRHPIPSDKGKIVKIYYATQIASMPPTIALIMNRPNALHFSYKRYLVNYFRANFDFSGVPIVILAKGRNKIAQMGDLGGESIH